MEVEILVDSGAHTNVYPKDFAEDAKPEQEALLAACRAAFSNTSASCAFAVSANRRQRRRVLRQAAKSI